MNRRLLLSSLALSLLLSLYSCDRIISIQPPIEGEAPGECSDGIDNDQDGLTDCDDDGCVADPNCTGDDDDSAGDDDDSAGDDDDSAPGDDDDSAPGDDDDSAPGDDDDSSSPGLPTGTDGCAVDDDCLSGVCWDFSTYDPWCGGTMCTQTCSTDTECHQLFTTLGAPSPLGASCGFDGRCDPVGTGLGLFWCA
jgi:hypothetical protein